MAINPISIRPSSIACVLGAIGFILALASIMADLAAYMIYDELHFYWFLKPFSFELERNIPTYFSQLLLLFASLLLAIITVLKRKERAPQVSHWAILSFGFLSLAADEAFSLHESLMKPMREMLGHANLGIFFFGWVIPAIIIVFVLALFFLKFLLRLPAKTRFAFLFAAAVYIGGAIGFEMIEGSYAELYGHKNLMYKVFTTVEEGLEMAGVIIFIWALLVYLADNYKEVRLQFEGVPFPSAISLARSQAVLGGRNIPELSLGSQSVQLENEELKSSTSSRNN